jgi:hypothetical protein
MRPQHHPQIIQKRIFIIIVGFDLGPKLHVGENNKAEDEHNEEDQKIGKFLRHVLNNRIKKLQLFIKSNQK